MVSGAGLEKRWVDLLDDLQGVAAVDEDGGFLQQDAGKAGRALEAGEPGQPLGCGRDVLALVLVAAGYQEALDAAPGEFPAEGGKAVGRLSSGDGGALGGGGRHRLNRSEERRVGKECVRTGRSRGSPSH